VDWIHLAQDRDQCCDLVKTVMKLRIPQKAGNFFTNFSRTTVLHGFVSQLAGRQKLKHIVTVLLIPTRYARNHMLCNFRDTKH
jgi:hypothetical protein